jgi:hypothetical protein
MGLPSSDDVVTIVASSPGLVHRRKERPRRRTQAGLRQPRVAQHERGRAPRDRVVRLLGVERAGLLTGAMPAGALLTGALLGHAALSPGRLAGVLAVAAGLAVGMRAARAP